MKTAIFALLTSWMLLVRHPDGSADWLADDQRTIMRCPRAIKPANAACVDVTPLLP